MITDEKLSNMTFSRDSVVADMARELIWARREITRLDKLVGLLPEQLYKCPECGDMGRMICGDRLETIRRCPRCCRRFVIGENLVDAPERAKCPECVELRSKLAEAQEDRYSILAQTAHDYNRLADRFDSFRTESDNLISEAKTVQRAQAIVIDAQQRRLDKAQKLIFDWRPHPGETYHICACKLEEALE